MFSYWSPAADILSEYTSRQHFRGKFGEKEKGIEGYKRLIKVIWFRKIAEVAEEKVKRRIFFVNPGQHFVPGGNIKSN
jgi:hypothetical protein